MSEEIKTRYYKFDAFDGFAIGMVLGFVLCAFVYVCYGCKSERCIQQDMVKRGCGFYTCDEKTGAVKFEYYKLEDVDAITDKVYNERSKETKVK